VLIVAGGLALAGERVRPETFRSAGVFFILLCTVLFTARDNLVRWLATGHTTASPEGAVFAALAGAVAAVVVYLTIQRGPRAAAEGVRRTLPVFAPAGVIWGGSLAMLFEAYYRGRVSVVNPLIAIESLWTVLIAAIFLRRSELVSRHVWIGAALVVAGGALIGAFR
jgi:uncharacterized membrane protein